MTNPIIDLIGTKKWFNNAGEWHREDGPAIEWENGDKSWIVNGKSHRLDGPAREWGYDNNYYYINGQQLTKDEWESHPLRKDYVIKENLKSILHD